MSTKMGVCSECGKSPKAERGLKPEEVRKRFLNSTNDEAARWLIEEANRSDFDVLLGSAETKPKAEWIFKLISKTVVARKKFIKHLKRVGFKEAELRSLVRV